MSLMTVGTRAVVPSDEAFLREVYAATREDELALVNWSAAAKDAFVAMQFEAQARHYHTTYPDADFSIILVDGQPAGRMYVHRGTSEITLLDIILMPLHRSRGIGTRLVAELVEEGAETGIPVRLHVEGFNHGARLLYERLGFRAVDDGGVYIQMEWKHPGVAHPLFASAAAEATR